VKFVLAAFFVLFSAFATAERDYGLFVGAGFGLVEADAVDAFEQNVSFKVGEAFGGAYWRWIGVELRQGTSLENETVNQGTNAITGVPVLAETSIDSYTSQYLRLQFANDVARLYGLYGSTDIETRSIFSDRSFALASASGDSYGAGIGVNVNDHLSFNLEYRVLFSNDDTSFTMTGMNVDFRF